MRPAASGLIHDLAALTRVKDWWPYKLPALAGTAYASAWITGTPLVSLWPTLLVLLSTLALSASYVSIVNDDCDREEDLACGKFNFLNQRSRRFALIALSICLALGITATAFLIKEPVSALLYWGTWLVFAAYSTPPLRLKRFGFVGCLADALGANTLPHLYTTVFIFSSTGQPVPPAWLACIALWSTAMGLRGIFWHQLADLENDLKSGVTTFASRHPPQLLNIIAKYLIFPLEIAGFAGMLLIAQSSVAWVALLFYLCAMLLYRQYWKTPITIMATGPNQRVLMMEFYDLFYPLAYLIASTSLHVYGVMVLAMHFLLFRQRLAWWVKDLYGLARWELWPRLPYRTNGKTR